MYICEHAKQVQVMYVEYIKAETANLPEAESFSLKRMFGV